MNKQLETQVKCCIQTEKHPSLVSQGFCSLLEHQSLVDIAICCGSNILLAHKLVLAANSPMFREKFEQNSDIEQIVLSGIEFSVIRSLIEFMYCGETFITEDLIKYLVALGRMLQMEVLENLSHDQSFSDDYIALPEPQFLTKKPKYPAFPFNKASSPSSCSLPVKPVNYKMNLYKFSKKRKGFEEAEHQACLKEALASRRAIANLKKEIGIVPQSSTFIIEDSCTETTVENFIPNSTDPGFVELDVNGQLVLPENQGFAPDLGKANIIELTIPSNDQSLTADKIKKILGNQADSNVEIMFRTNDGKFVTVTDDVLQNLQKDGLQYQVIDEEGRMGEVQELQLINKDQSKKLIKHTSSEEQFFDMPKLLDVPQLPDLQHTVVLPLINQDEMMQDVKPSQDFEVTHFFQHPKTEVDSMTIPENMLFENSIFPSDMFLAEPGENCESDKKKNLNKKGLMSSP